MIGEPIKTGTASTEQFKRRKFSVEDWVFLGLGVLVLMFACWLAFIDVERDFDFARWVGVVFSIIVGLGLVVTAFLVIEEAPKKPPLENETPHGDAGLASWDEATRALRGDTDWQRE